MDAAQSNNLPADSLLTDATVSSATVATMDDIGEQINCISCGVSVVDPFRHECDIQSASPSNIGSVRSVGESVLHGLHETMDSVANEVVIPELRGIGEERVNSEELLVIPGERVDLGGLGEESIETGVVVEPGSSGDMPEQGSFICDTCGVAFSLLEEFRRHLYKHSDEKKYKCDLCGDNFKWPSLLDYHLDNKHALNEYICNLCDKKFKNRITLKKHKKMPEACRKNQLRPKDLTCHLCGKKSTKVSNYTRHIKTCKEKQAKNGLADT